ncbi:MAG: amidohydrolase family protein [Candidatus Binatia bacterium]
MIPFPHFVFQYHLHALYTNPLFWFILQELERTHWQQNRQWGDVVASLLTPNVSRLTSPVAPQFRNQGRARPPHGGRQPTIQRALAARIIPATANQQPISWQQLPGELGTATHVIYQGPLSGPDLLLHYGFDGWQGPITEVRLERGKFGFITREPIVVAGHITLDCAVTDGQLWDNNNDIDYRLWIGFDPLDSHLHASGKGRGDLGLGSLQVAMASAGMRQGIVSWVNNEALDRIRWTGTGLFPLVWVRPGETPQKEVRTRLAAGHVGLKLHPTVDDYRADDTALDPYLEIAAEAGCPVACHSAPGDADPDHIRRLAERFPSVPIIFYHTYLGPAEGRHRAAQHVREQPNLYLETSWCGWHTVVELVEAAGVDRVLFGSDASVDGAHHYCRHPPNVEGHETYNQGLVPLVRALGPKAARSVLGDNARRLFGLERTSRNL